MIIGILGTGFGCYHLEQYKKMEEVEQIIIWGRNEEKLNELKSDKVITTTNMDDILKNEQVELIDVCLPNELHKKYILCAMQSSKNVICEVPLVLNSEDLNEVVQYKKRSGNKCYVDLFERFDYANEFLKDVVDTRKYGKLRSIQVYRNTPPWWGSLGRKNIVFHLMIHEIDLINWLLGDTDHITVNHTFVNDDKGIVRAHLCYKSTIAEIASSTMMPGQYPFSVGYEAIFDQAVIKYSNDGYSDHEETILKVITDQDTSVIPIPEQNSYYKSLKTAVEAITGQQHTIHEIEYAQHTIELAEKINALL